ncbi:MAG: hypothetical protein DWQ07_22975 [Chloroflexi bacterium]|nr:MAG: hypothetical protein DWQ07_22975 [Chloroflexota bacterium]MBL1194012.1 hypothetical protein [Chloroflexota bacterium]NOH11306.1 hypothetical protein [Chloroflexota bacterium]
MNRSRTLILAFVLVLILAIAALFLREIFRESIVQPFYLFLSLLQLLYLSIPQSLQWAALIGVGILVAFRSLYIRRKRSHEEIEQPVEDRSRLQTWARWIELSQEGQYFQLHMARQLGDLTLAVIAHKEVESIEQVRERARAGKAKTPDHILKFLDLRLSRVNYRRFQQVLPRFNLGKTHSLQELGYEPIVDYLESELELDNEQ